ncbi:DUF2510 domain-containing protein [Microbacterium dextranolyticum]|nr:DUF2510 domain-containing protein [Microbacterium dextranolyticum]MBM7462190.1 hypothetical protein [Microbacterium dextranolyticum]
MAKRDDHADFIEVIAKVPRVGRDGAPITPDDLATGGARRDDGSLSALAYDMRMRDDDEIDEVVAPSYVSTGNERLQAESETVSLGGALAGLALIGLTIGALSVAGSVQEKRRRRRDHRRLPSRVEPIAAPPGWYELDDGRLRWWDGSDWTEHFQPAPRSEDAPAGWYDDGSGRQRWWDGIAWTQHFQPARALTSGAPQAGGQSFVESTSQAMDVSNDVPRIAMSSAEWQERMRAMLLARAISEQQWRLLSRARIEDAGDELLGWQQHLASLTPQQFSDQLNNALEADPGFAQAALETARAGWYDDGSGQERWWTGSEWTDEYRAERLAVRSTTNPSAAPGMYDDGSGRARWWNGQSWV